MSLRNWIARKAWGAAGKLALNGYDAYAVNPGIEDVWHLRGFGYLSSMGVRIFDMSCPAVIGANDLIYLYMPADRIVADILEKSDGLTIVDITGDVFGLVAPDDVPQYAKIRGSNSEAMRWWRDPEHPERIEALARSLRAATVVTTSFDYLVNPLREFNDNVVLLPDAQPVGDKSFVQNFHKIVDNFGKSER